MTTPGAGHASHGPLVEEAAKLAEALATGWSAFSASGFLTSLLSGVGESEECNVCPVCQLLRVAKGTRPEVYEHLAEASTALVAAFRAAIESSQAAWAAGSHPTSERIDIS